MKKRGDSSNAQFGAAATYRIRVRGVLSPEWSNRLAGMTITAGGGEESGPSTLLVGRLRDEAELGGVLESLCELHLSILNVERIES